MKQRRWSMLMILAAVVFAATIPNVGIAQQKKLILWTHWEQNPDFNKWYEAKGKEFAKKTGYEVEVVTVPYQGYEAKYLAGFMAKSSAPDMFMGMTHQWCGQYDFCDKMPADLAKTWDENLPKYMLDVGKWKGARYGIPIEHGNFQQMYINVDMFKKAGLNPDDPPKTMDAFLADLKKLTIADPKGGEPTQVGFAIRSKGHPVGITDKFLPFAHAWGARLLSPDMEKATGYANSPQMVAALTFFGDLVLKDKVASLSFGNPEDACGQKRAAVIFRESWFFGWLKKNAPDLNFKVYALPCEKACPGAGAVPLDGPRLQKQPEQANGVGVLPVHQQCQGRPRASSDAGDTSGLDGEPRYALREVPARLPVYKGHARAAGAADLFPPEVERVGYRLRRRGRGRSVRQRTAEALAGRSCRQDGSHPQGLEVC
ncbi:MAG: extracellular solute-binding protein [Betaproteobacteria bacterium]|nr:MAG: extracellular solute-binding protein [Betaproteobacteria bacterium]